MIDFEFELNKLNDWDGKAISRSILELKELVDSWISENESNKEPQSEIARSGSVSSYTDSDNQLEVSNITLVDSLNAQIDDESDMFLAELGKLRQSSSVHEYYEEFIRITTSSRLPDDEYRVYLFVCGLNEETRCYVNMFDPMNLDKAYTLAILHEFTLNFQKSKSIFREEMFTGKKIEGIVDENMAYQVLDEMPKTNFGVDNQDKIQNIVVKDTSIRDKKIQEFSYNFSGFDLENLSGFWDLKIEGHVNVNKLDFVGEVVDFDRIARRSDFTGADLHKLMNEADILVTRSDVTGENGVVSKALTVSKLKPDLQLNCLSNQVKGANEWPLDSCTVSLFYEVKHQLPIWGNFSSSLYSQNGMYEYVHKLFVGFPITDGALVYILLLYEYDVWICKPPKPPDFIRHSYVNVPPNAYSMCGIHWVAQMGTEKRIPTMSLSMLMVNKARKVVYLSLLKYQLNTVQRVTTLVVKGASNGKQNGDTSYNVQQQGDISFWLFTACRQKKNEYKRIDGRYQTDAKSLVLVDSNIDLTVTDRSGTGEVINMFSLFVKHCRLEDEWEAKIGSVGGQFRAKLKKDTNRLVVNGVPDNLNAEMRKARKMKVQILWEDYLVDCFKREKKLRFELYKIEASEEANKSMVTVKVKGRSAVDESSGLQVTGHILEHEKSIYNTTLSLSDLSTGNNSYYILQIIENDKGSNCHVFRKWGRVDSEKIGRSINHFEQIENLQRPITMEACSFVLMDLLWSDPTESDSVEVLQPNAKGSGLVTFGPDHVIKFCNNNDRQLIVRAHECVMDGWSFVHRIIILKCRFTLVSNFPYQLYTFIGAISILEDKDVSEKWVFDTGHLDQSTESQRLNIY